MKQENKIIGSTDPVDITHTKIILNQMINCICKIKTKDSFGTGFFCKIQILNMIFLMTNYHVLSEEYINKNKEINILLNDDNEALIIDLNIERKKYFNKEYDITLIEIKEKIK